MGASARATSRQRKVGRAVECTGLEIRRAGNGTVSSNLTPSAIPLVSNAVLGLPGGPIGVATWYADWEERPMEYLFGVGLALLADKPHKYRAEDYRRFAAVVATVIAELYPNATLPRLRQQSYQEAEELMARRKQPAGTHQE